MIDRLDKRRTREQPPKKISPRSARDSKIHLFIMNSTCKLNKEPSWTTTEGRVFSLGPPLWPDKHFPLVWNSVSISSHTILWDTCLQKAAQVHNINPVPKLTPTTVKVTGEQDARCTLQALGIAWNISKLTRCLRRFLRTYSKQQGIPLLYQS